jgi:hypothetical protein
MPAVDGVVTRLRRTLEELERAGDEVLVIAPDGGPASYAGAPVVGVRTLTMPLYPDGGGYPPKRVSLPGPTLPTALRLFRPDVVHAINPVLLAAGNRSRPPPAAAAGRLPPRAPAHLRPLLPPRAARTRRLGGTSARCTTGRT